MSKIPTITEQALSGLKPNELDENFMEHLASCAEGSSLELSADELEFENSLRSFKPASLPASLKASLADSISDTPFQVDEKIVLFHKGSKAAEKVTEKRTFITRFNFAAAAAVALLGALTALMIPNQQADLIGESAAPSHSVAPDISTPANVQFAPASFNRNLSDTHDEGVIWDGQNSPHRVLRLTYKDQATLKNEKGETFQFEQPRDEFVIIPEKID